MVNNVGPFTMNMEHFGQDNNIFNIDADTDFGADPFNIPNIDMSLMQPPQMDGANFGFTGGPLNTPNVAPPQIDMTNFAMGNISMDGIIATGGSPLIHQMTTQGAQFDQVVASQEAMLPQVMTQIYSVQVMMAQNPQLAPILSPMLQQLREQQRGIQQLVDARTEMMDGINAIYDSISKSISTASGNIKSAANSVGDLASSIGDINVGKGIGETDS